MATGEPSSFLLHRLSITIQLGYAVSVLATHPKSPELKIFISFYLNKYNRRCRSSHHQKLLFRNYILPFRLHNTLYLSFQGAGLNKPMQVERNKFKQYIMCSVAKMFTKNRFLAISCL